VHFSACVESIIGNVLPAQRPFNVVKELSERTRISRGPGAHSHPKRQRRSSISRLIVYGEPHLPSLLQHGRALLGRIDGRRRKLGFAESRKYIGIAKTAFQHVRSLAPRVITGFLARSFIDLLQSFEVRVEQEMAALAAPRQIQMALRQRQKSPPVAEMCELIGKRLRS
jgi:hypothetical protein